MKQPRIHLDRLIWALLLLSWSAFITQLVVSDQILLYLHPKMIGFAVAAALGFGLLGLVRFSRALKATNSSAPRIGYLAFALPLLLSLTAGHRGLGSTALGTRLLKTAADTSSVISVIRDNLGLEARLSALNPGDTLVVDDLIFADLFYDMTERPHRYDGLRLEVLGFAHRTPGLSASSLFVTRLLLTCCAADSEPLGILAHGPLLQRIGESEWLRVEGQVALTRYNNPYTGQEIDLPVILVDSVAVVSQPSVPYIYPSTLTP